MGPAEGAHGRGYILPAVHRRRKSGSLGLRHLLPARRSSAPADVPATSASRPDGPPGRVDRLPLASRLAWRSQASTDHLILTAIWGEMSTDSINSILDELNRDLNDLTAAHAFSVMGLREIPARLASVPKYPANPDPVISIGIEPPGPETPAYAAWRLSEALTQVEQNGPVETRLGHLWITSLYALWEEEYRPRLAIAHGRSPGDEKYDLFGDLRHLRNDVVHHGGIATTGNTGHCVVLRWFQPGDVIRLEGRHFNEFLRLIRWSDLAVGTNSQ